jgi:hypothetical protein
MRYFAASLSFCRCTAPVLLAFTAAVSAFAQQNWRWVNSIPASSQWKDVAFGNGVYVAVGLDATIATSTDGASWTIRRMSTAQTILNAVEFAAGRFVAAGMGTPDRTGAALVMTSTDGISWTTNETVANAVNAQLLDIAYGGGTWVISGFGGARFLSSTDGSTWTQRGAPGFAVPAKVAYGAGRFVAPASGNTAYTSTDGTTWTSVTVAASTNTTLEAVAFGSGKFIVVGRDSNFLAAVFTSADGTTWTPANAIPGAVPGNGFIAAAASPTGFVAAGGSFVYSSADGVTWTARTSGLPSVPGQLGSNTEGVSGASYANNQFFVVGIAGSIVSSPDGTTWTRRSAGTVANLGAVLHDGTRFVATGSGGTVVTSTNGSAWTQLTTGSTADFNTLAFGAGRYVTAGFNGIYHSANLTNWTAVSGTTFDRWTAAAYGGGRFVVANSATTLGVRHSTDGVTWSTAVGIGGAGGNTNGLVYGNGVFVLTMVGFGSTPAKIYTSTDGTGWVQRGAGVIPTGTSLFSVAFGAGRFVILTGNRTSLTSTDGITWTLNQLPSTFTLNRVRFLGGQFYAAASTYGAPNYVSADGVTWSPVGNSFGPNLMLNMNSTGGYPHFAASGSTVVAVGPQGMILLGDLPAASAAGRLVNMSIRTNAGTDDATLIVGVGLGGAGTQGSKAVLLRGVGPTLGVFGVGGALSDTVMTVFQGTTQVAQNDNWDATAGNTFAGLGAFAFGAGSLDSAIYNNAIPSGSYSIQIAGKAGATGIALAEIYDASPSASFTATTPRLVNVSARTQVGTGDNILIAGFVVGGSTPVRVLIRAVGPTLGVFGVGGALADPKLEVYDSAAAKIGENDNWAGTAALKTAFSSVAAFAFSADNSADAALVATLQPGSYTVQVSGVNAATGVALVELYELP